MENLNIDARKALKAMANEIQASNSQTKIVAASFKNVGQVTTALEQSTSGNGCTRYYWSSFSNAVNCSSGG